MNHDQAPKETKMKRRQEHLNRRRQSPSSWNQIPRSVLWQPAQTQPGMTLRSTDKQQAPGPGHPMWCVLRLIALVVVLTALAGCGAQAQNKNQKSLIKAISGQQSQASQASQAYAGAPPLLPGTETPGPETTGTPDYLTPIAATHVAFETAVTVHRQEIQTEVALTHAPTTTPGRPQELPSPTPMLGMLPACSNPNANVPQAISCWRGVLNGQLVDVDAGKEGLDGNPTQGIVRVHVHGGQGDDIYQTPSTVGGVRIVSVVGVLVTLATVDQPTPQVFVFDLATRRWVSP